MEETQNLQQAVRDGDVKAASKLIALGSSVNKPDATKRTPLHLAAWRGDDEMVQLLIRAQANVQAKAMDNFTALHFASSPGVVKLLVAKDRSLLGARVSKGNKTALHLAASKGLVPVVEALLNCGADINAKTAQGQTAIEISKSEAVRRLLQDWKPPAPSAEPADDSSLLSGIDRAAENKRRRQDKDVDDDMDESATRSAPASLHSTSTSTIATAAGVTVSSRDIEESGLPAVSAEEDADTGTGTSTGTGTGTDTVPAVDPAVADAAAVGETSSSAKRARKAPLLSHLLHDD